MAHFGTTQLVEPVAQSGTNLTETDDDSADWHAQRWITARKALESAPFPLRMLDLVAHLRSRGVRAHDAVSAVARWEGELTHYYKGTWHAGPGKSYHAETMHTPKPTKLGSLSARTLKRQRAVPRSVRRK